jgi:serine phosphatase RsbU (regulator of sigma subunit)/pSer/pThr/pTyr-binding forkhead associated (FHA) protein
MTPRLDVDDPLGRRTVAIDTPTFTIGRRDGHHLQLAGSEVSRDHAEIQTVDGLCTLHDRGSRYGTFVNGQRISEWRLSHGDRVQFGRTGSSATYLAATPADTQTAPVATGGELRQVAVLLEALRQMGAHRVLDEVLALVLDTAIDTAGAERGFIMLADRKSALEMKVARATGRVALPLTGFDTSRKIPEAVFLTGNATVVADLSESEMAAVHTGTVALGIRHVLCVPLQVVRYVERRADSPTGERIGVLYLDSREKGRLLSADARAAIEALASEAALAIDNARLYQEAIEKARIDEELAVASAIQQALLPDLRKSGTFFEAVATSVPSRTIGGDFFDYQDLPDGSFRFGLGDVTGKGPPAALMAALVQGVLASTVHEAHRPGELASILNRILLARPIEARFLTIFVGVLDPSGRLTYCTAAPPPPLLFTSGATRRLDVGGTLIGAFAEARFDDETVTLAAGDTVVLVSDGVTEATNAAGDQFDEEGVQQAVAAAIAGTPEQILEALVAAVRRFIGGAPQSDDITAVVLRYAPRVPAPSDLTASRLRASSLKSPRPSRHRRRGPTEVP